MTNLVFLLRTKLEKLHLLLIDLARGLKHFGDVELTKGGDENQASMKYMKLEKFHGRPKIKKL